MAETATRHYCDGSHHRGPALAILCLGHWCEILGQEQKPPCGISRSCQDEQLVQVL